MADDEQYVTKEEFEQFRQEVEYQFTQLIEHLSNIEKALIAGKSQTIAMIRKGGSSNNHDTPRPAGNGVQGSDMDEPKQP